jgi:hypothetical protein
VGRPPGSSAGWVRLLGAAGTVAAALVAHVGAGAAAPRPVLLLGAVAAVAGLAAVAGRLPIRLRTARMYLAAGVALQPVLHGVFELKVPSGHVPGPTTAADAMLLAHLAAAGVGAWWLARGAARLVSVLEGLTALLVPARPALTVIPAKAVAVSIPAAVQIGSRLLLASVSRRGPPVRVQPRPV